MNNKINRVVVTGMGAVTSFGAGVKQFWNSLLKNRNGITLLDSRIYKGEIVNIGAPLPKLEPDTSLTKDIQPEDSDVKPFFMAVDEAVSMAGLQFNKMDADKLERVGAFIADRQMNPIRYLDRYSPLLKKAFDDGDDLLEHKLDKLLEKQHVIPYDSFNESCSINHFVARRYSLSGPMLSIATACASGNSAIEEGSERIHSGDVDIVIAGGAYNIDLAGMIGFSRIGALSPNPDPDTASRPFDADRDGFVMGSGCGILILEGLEHALSRGVEILCEVAGYGTVIDAFRATDPDPDAKASAKAIRDAMQMAGVSSQEVDYINAHGTSTQLNDLTETKAIKNVMGNDAYQIPISSTKSMIGHAILASAALEAIVCVCSIRDGVIHATRNWKTRAEELDLDYVPYRGREKTVNCCLSNSFGFGGINTCLVLKSFH